MTARNHATDSFDQDTLPELDSPILARDVTGPSREVCNLDFKDGRTRVTVTHGPLDPSRIWITLRSEHASVQVSIEEGVGRQIAQGLASVLPTFRSVRSRVR
jgi:hypothetical protein